LLYEIFERFTSEWGALNILRYESVRAAAAFIVAFSFAAITGGRIIELLRRRRIGEQIKSDSSRVEELHAGKAGTPTMGGVIILAALLASMLVAGRFDSFHSIVAVGVTLALGLVGMIDDKVKLTDTKLLGLSPGHKMFYILLVVGLASAALAAHHIQSGEQSLLAIAPPLFKDVRIPLTALGGVVFVMWSMVVISGTSNAVNLTDGLDGLAAGCTATAVAAFGVLAFFVGNETEASRLFLPHVPGAGELAVFCAAMTGSLLGFLWFNCYPAQVFMGDTGSLAIGGAVGFVAMSLRQEILLVLVGGVFVLEALSVILQTGWFKLTRLRTGEGRRIFLCAPLHHHYQEQGVHETKISIRLHIVALLCAVAGVALTLKVR